MSAEPHKRFDERFVVCAPTGRDGSLTRTLLKKAGIDALVCVDLAELCERAEREGCAGLLLAEEVLSPAAIGRLRDLLAAQESWSDLPILVFTTRATALQSSLVVSLGNTTLLERPLRPITMVSAVASALRARRRQYAARAELLEQQRAVRQRDQFLAMLGHELRNPLAAIAMAVDLGEGTDRTAYRAILERQTRHLTRLVDDLLDVSRVTSGKISLRSKRLDLVELVERCAESFAGVLQTQGLALALALPEHPLVIQADPVRLEQILVNLLTNAAKYTPSGGHIEVAVEASDDEVSIAVRDDGVGIPPEMLGRVFDLFAQVEGTLDRAKGGMGIGLTLVRTLVELHGGKVGAASAGPGQGSVFTVRLPAGAKKAADGPAPSGTSLPPPSDGRCVLVIEDNSDSRALLQMGLSRRGHRVSASTDGFEGIETALRERPEVMLVDIGLPGLDGYGVAQRVRALLGRSVYLIALTGYGQPEDRARALAAGFDMHLTKPVDFAELENVLRQASAADVG